MKKFLAFCAIIIIIICIGIAGFSIWNKSAKTEYKALNDTDQTMFNQLSKIYKTFGGQGKDIWSSDYTFDDVSLVLTPVSKNRGSLHTYSYVVGDFHTLKKSIFAKAIEMPEDLNLPPVYRVVATSPQHLGTFFPANFSFKTIEEKRVMYFKYWPNLLNTKGEGSFTYFLIHEAFHEFRQVLKWPNVLNDDDFQQALDNGLEDESLITILPTLPKEEQNYLYLILEGLILDQAFKASDNQVEEILKDWAVVRQYRHDTYPVITDESKIETLEGTARYVEYRYAKAVGETYPLPIQGSDQEATSFSFLYKQDTINQIIDNNRLQGLLSKNLYYYTGSTLGALMDRLNIPWREKVEKGELLPQILTDSLQVPKQDSDYVQYLLQKYGGDQYHSTARLIINSITAKE